MSAWKAIAQQWYLWRLALGFLSRIPVSAGQPSAQQMAASRRYFALVGVVLGALAALVYSILSFWLPADISILLALCCALALSGGLHEDGLADTIDGIGGGQTPARRLEIMKDSRIGSYAAMALVCVLLLRFLLLDTLESTASGVVTGLIVAAGLSRAAAVLMMTLLPYARLDNSKVVALSDPQSTRDIVLVVVTALVPALWLVGGMTTLMLVVALGLLLAGLRCWFKRRIGGYTGDCLGATQQLAEVLVLMILVGH